MGFLRQTINLYKAENQFKAVLSKKNSYISKISS